MRRGVRYWLNLFSFALAILALILFLVLAGISYIYTGLFTRTPCIHASQTPDQFGIGSFEEVAFQTPDGVTAHGWYVPPSNNAVVILAPGLGGSRDDMLGDAAILARHGYGLLIYDARQCNVPGAKNTIGYVETNELLGAVEYLGRRDAGVRIGALGFSEGGTVVILGAARDERIRAVVAEGGYHDLAQHIYHGSQSPLVRRLVEGQVLMFYRLDTGVDPARVSPAKEIHRISPRPILLIYGEFEAERGGAPLLYAAAREPKELWIVPNAGHGGYLYAAPQEYEQRVVAFFGQSLREEVHMTESIYHLTPAEYFNNLPADQPYRPREFDRDGFIHCTKGEERLLLVADTLYRRVPGDFLALVIDERKVTPPLKYENVGGILFPHIYGGLNRDAIARVVTLGRRADGTFLPIGEPDAAAERAQMTEAWLSQARAEQLIAESTELRVRTTERIAQLERAIAALQAPASAPAQPAQPTAPAAAVASPTPAPALTLEARVAQLEAQVSNLNSQVSKLKAARAKQRQPAARKSTLGRK